MQSLSSLTVPDPSSTLIPSPTQISYSVPALPVLLSLSAYLYLLSVTSTLADRVIHAPLIGPLITGVLLGPVLAGLLSPSTQQAFIALGYIGLLLIVFEAGLTTHIPLLISNIGVSIAAALTGVVLPIAFSLALLHGAYGYTKLQSFAAGAALCSTSLGTTLALLTPRLRKTKVGSVLMCAALLDDVVGLVIAGIIANLANSEGGTQGVKWETVVRPVLVSIAFGVGSPVLAFAVRWLIRFDWGRFSIFCHLERRQRNGRTPHSKAHSSLICDTRTQLFLIVCTLSGFVAGSSYAGTSELFGAYLAGAFLAYVFGDPVVMAEMTPSCSPSSPPIVELRGPQSQPQSQPIQVDKKDMIISKSFVAPNAYIEPIGPETMESQPKKSTRTPSEDNNPTLESFNTHIAPILTSLLGPIFFASVGAAIPVGSMFTTTTTRLGSGAGEQVKSHSVVWKGIVYALVMSIAKAAVGVWMVVRRDRNGRRVGRVADIQEADDPNEPGRDGRSPVGRVNQSDLEMGTNEDGNVINEPSPSILGSPECFSGQNRRLSGLDSSQFSDNTDISPKTAPHITTPMESSPSPTPSPPSMPSSNGMPGHAIGTDEPSPVRAALLLGLAMIARGEIALIVAQLARPLLVQGTDDDEEPYAVVIWAIVFCTVGGALGVGWLLGRWEREERCSKRGKGDRKEYHGG